MFTLNDDLSIYATRGDIVFFSVTAEEDGKNYKFQPGDVVRIKVYGKKDAEDVVLQKDFPVIDITEKVAIFLTKEDMKIGDVISKHKDYWYEVVLNDDTLPQTIIGYDEDGAKLFRLFPEGDDIPEYVPTPEEIPVVDDELDMTSTRPVQNQAVARAFAKLEDGYERTFAAVSEKFVTPQMFGAIGDGEADDTEAIRNALASALDLGTPLYFPKGVYIVTGNFVVNAPTADLTIYGNNAEIKLTAVYQTALVDNLLKVESCKNLTIRGLVFNGSDTGDIATAQNGGLYVNNADNCIIENCVFKSFTGNGVYISYEVKNFHGRNNQYLQNHIHGLTVTNYYTSLMENEIMDGNLGQGFDIVLYQQSYLDVIAEGKYKIVSMKNCRITNNGSGSNEKGQPYSSGGKLYGCYLAKVENCLFENNGHETYAGQQLRICNANFGADIVNGHIVIDNCKFNANNLNQQAIADHGCCELLNITNCQFQGAFYNIIQDRSRGVIENNFFDCTCDTSASNGVKVQCSGITVRNNVYTETFNKLAVIAVADSTIPQAVSLENVVVDRNIVKGAQDNSVMLFRMDNGTISDNVIPSEKYIELQSGSNNIVRNTGIVKNLAKDTYYEGYSGNENDRSWLVFAGTGTPKVGTQFFNTKTQTMQVWTGEAWV